mgnify:CR=1 FL=1
MQEVEAMCDRVVIIDKGKIVADDTTSKLSKMAGSGIVFKVEFKEKLNEKQLLNIYSHNYHDTNSISPEEEKFWKFIL